MSKLTEQQMNLIYIGIGVFFVLIFGYMTYSDTCQIEELEGQIASVQNSVNEAKKKKNEIPKLTEQLWVMHQKFDFHKKVLPEVKEDNFVRFYDTLETIRAQKGIKPWSYFRTIQDVSEDLAKQQNIPEAPKGRSARTKTPVIKTSYEEDKVEAAAIITFDQLGQLLSEIENQERIYSVQGINIAKVLPSQEGGDTEMEVALHLTSYRYTGKMPSEEEVLKFIDSSIYEPSSKIQKQLEEQKNNEWIRKDKFIWTKPPYDPFDKDKVIRLATPPEDIIQVHDDSDMETKIQVPLVQEQLAQEIENLQNIRNYLHMLTVAESWIELQNALVEKKYESQLMALKITKANDPDGVFGNKVTEMQKELKGWKFAIQEADRQKRARQLTVAGLKKLRDMEALYEEGKIKGDQKILYQVQSLHNEFIPQLKEYADLESKISGLEILRNKMENLYTKTENQIKILQLASRLQLKGIIYMKHNPDLSVAFVNEDTVKKNDVISMGFVVQSIEADGIILRYKEETVPIIMVKNTQNTKE
ncbi:MAG TPA: hypothetical protein P5543_05790 [Planctomycetota bacterium]|nr:hypothetical protein [Planctomycetota bacterium]